MNLLSGCLIYLGKPLHLATQRSYLYSWVFTVMYFITSANIKLGPNVRIRMGLQALWAWLSTWHTIRKLCGIFYQAQMCVSYSLRFSVAGYKSKCPQYRKVVASSAGFQSGCLGLSNPCSLNSMNSIMSLEAHGQDGNRGGFIPWWDIFYLVQIGLLYLAPVL